MHPCPTPTAGAGPRTAAPAQTPAEVDLLAVGQLFLDVLFGVLPSPPVPGQEIFTDRAALVPGGPAPATAAAAEPETRGAVSIALHLGPEEMPWLAASDARVWADVGWDASGAWDPGVLRHLAHCEGFVPNAEEAIAFTRTDSAPAAARRLAEQVPLVVVTRGAEGALGIDARSGLEVDVRAPALGPVATPGPDRLAALAREHRLPCAEALDALAASPPGP